MKSFIATLLLMAAMIVTANAQFPDYVKVLDVELNKTKTVKGDLSEGRFIDLRFGMRGSVSCFTEAQKRYFSGHHRLYAFEVPANTKVLVEVSTNNDMSLYGYMIDAQRFDVPPYLENVSKSGCQSSAKPSGELDRIMMKAGSVKTHVIVAVTGLDENSTGAYTLKITTRQ
ncbi:MULTISPECIES: hypothetical protein [unclassified Aureispira]|uniref:hypothetical protein n=1 Tax=unclassified Aureispira TaxID=2649989 RepID=UPI0012DD06EF|nr:MULTISPECIES: hypothetical protein [unclassified Aureispira]WMX15053.1 hypothetical protein QP953_01560 [Aureispira sp. CCB-E]